MKLQARQSYDKTGWSLAANYFVETCLYGDVRMQGTAGTKHRTCRKMEALMAGMMPSENTPTLEMLPPVMLSM